jgi:hypothetical protein
MIKIYPIFVNKKIEDMLSAPIAEGANIFIWIACILGGFVAGLIAIDTYKPGNKNQDQSE